MCREVRTQPVGTTSPPPWFPRAGKRETEGPQKKRRALRNFQGVPKESQECLGGGGAKTSNWSTEITDKTHTHTPQIRVSDGHFETHFHHTHTHTHTLSLSQTLESCDVGGKKKEKETF